MTDAIRRVRSPRITLTVTPEMIEKGIRQDSEHCIWAEALRAAVPDARSIAVDLQTIRFSVPKKGLRYSYLTPRVAQVSLVEFDQGIKPEPGSCRIAGAHVSAIAKTRVKIRSGVEMPPSRKKVIPGDDRNVTSQTGVPYGGSPPPIGALASGKVGNAYNGRRRAFGLRGLGRIATG